MDLDASYEPTGIAELKYTIDSTPSRWVYELLPSANIEGSFVVQDLQLKTRPKQKFSITAKTYDKDLASVAIYSYMDSLNSGYVNSGSGSSISAFLTNETFATGTYDVGLTREYLGEDKGISSGILMLKSVGTSSQIVPSRLKNYMFGY
jgi:hypothetical protein